MKLLLSASFSWDVFPLMYEVEVRVQEQFPSDGIGALGCYLMAAQEVTPPNEPPRLTPVPRQSQDFDTKHVASLGAERTEIPQRRRLMAGASSWL